MAVPVEVPIVRVPSDSSGPDPLPADDVLEFQLVGQLDRTTAHAVLVVQAVEKEIANS